MRKLSQSHAHAHKGIIHVKYGIVGDMIDIASWTYASFLVCTHKLHTNRNKILILISEIYHHSLQLASDLSSYEDFSKLDQ